MFGWGEEGLVFGMGISDSHSCCLVGGSPIPIPIPVGIGAFKIPKSNLDYSSREPNALGNMSIPIPIPVHSDSDSGSQTHPKCIVDIWYTGYTIALWDMRLQFIFGLFRFAMLNSYLQCAVSKHLKGTDRCIQGLDVFFLKIVSRKL